MIYTNSEGEKISFAVSDGVADEIGRFHYKIYIENLSTHESFSINWDWGFFNSKTFLDAMRERFCEGALRVMAKNAYDMRYIAGTVETCTAEDYKKYFRCFNFDEIKAYAVNFAKIVEPDYSKWADLAQVQED